MNHTYHQALRAAYDKGKAEGTLDEQTIKECEAEFSREKYVVPDTIVTLGGARPDGWQCYCRSGLQQGYEEAMDKARKRHGLPSLEGAQGVKEILNSDNLDLAQQPSSATDDHNKLKALFASAELSIQHQHQQMLTRMINIFKNIKSLTLERTELNVDSDRGNKKTVSR